MNIKMDDIDCRILAELQRDASQSQRTLSEAVGLSQNACWRRLKALEEKGAIRNHTVVLNRDLVGAGFVVFAMVRTRHHSEEWLKKLHRLVSNLPPVVDFYRIGGDYDYMLKIVARDMASYDACYRQLISEIDLETVTSLFVMEAIEEQRPIPLAAQRQN